MFKTKKQKESEEDIFRVYYLSNFILSVVNNKGYRANKLELQQLMFLVNDIYLTKYKISLINSDYIKLYRYGLSIEPIVERYRKNKREDNLEYEELTEEELKGETRLYPIVEDIVYEYVYLTYIDLLLKSKSKYSKYTELIIRD